MNPFENLSDYPILHIFSYLPRDDLLKLSRMDKKFNRIITESRETKAKIPLILDFKRPMVTEDVIKLACKREFTALKLKNVKMVISRDFHELLQCLSESVEHIEIRGSQFQEDQFRQLIQLFLPKLKTCQLFDIHGEYNARDKINDEVIPSHPLKPLLLDNNEMLKFFAGCKLLKSFHFSGKRHHSRVYEFLSHQTHLEKLSIDCRCVDLSRIRCFHLKELELASPNMSAVADFLKTLPNLEKLKVAITAQPDLDLILKAICSAPKLVDLSIDVFGEAKSLGNLSIIAANILCTSVNNIVKKLTIIDEHHEATLWPLQMFRGVDSVSLLCRSTRFHDKEFCINLLDPSNVPHDAIEKIKFEHVKERMHLQFSPRWVLGNVGSFELAVTKFAERFAAIIGTITIGHKNWRERRNFRLSNSFCEGLVNRLPKLTKLELYNVADRGNFLSYLDNNRKSLKNLEKVKLHTPNEDDPETKRMKIEAD